MPRTSHGARENLQHEHAFLEESHSESSGPYVLVNIGMIALTSVSFHSRLSKKVDGSWVGKGQMHV